MTLPLITCGVTAYNAEATIERAVRSALAQTWRPLEVIVVDDASTDRTGRILEGLRALAGRVRVLRNPRNLGVAATRNRILEESRGTFLAFFDDDDDSDPERIERQLERILDYERDFARGVPVICHTARRQIFPDGRVAISPTMGARPGRRAPFGDAVAEHILMGRGLGETGGACATSSQMARLSTYTALGGFDPAFRRSEDTELNVRLARAGGHFVGIAAPLVTQLMTFASEKRLDEERRYALQLLAKHRDLLDAAGEYEFTRLWIEGKHHWLTGRRWEAARGLGRLLRHHPRLCLRRLAAARGQATYNLSLRRFHRAAESAP
jgi:GT2 family glycosyltransferase